jgi:hypothetical protein
MACFVPHHGYCYMTDGTNHVSDQCYLLEDNAASLLYFMFGTVETFFYFINSLHLMFQHCVQFFFFFFLQWSFCAPSESWQNASCAEHHSWFSSRIAWFMIPYLTLFRHSCVVFLWTVTYLIWHSFSLRWRLSRTCFILSSIIHQCLLVCMLCISVLYGSVTC